MRKIDIYILKSLISSFVLSFSIITLVMMIGNIVKIYDLLFAKGVSLQFMSKIFFDMAVFLSIFTIPMALTIAINFVYGELSNNSEITALRSSGISLARVYFPAFLFTIIIFFMLFYDTSFMVYKSKLSYRKDIASAFKNKIYVGLREKTFYKGPGGFVLYAETVSANHKKLYNVFYSKKNSILVAKNAYFQDADFGTVINFRDVHIYDKKEGGIEYGKFASYKTTISMDSPKMTGLDSKNDPRYMNLNELMAAYKKTHNKDFLYKINKMIVFALSVFVMSLIGFSFGITFSRSGKSAGVIASVSLFFVFYILLMIGESIFKSYSIIWTIWLPDFVLLFFGLYLFDKKSKV